MSAVIYVRVSTTEQVENYSLGWQERACRAFCAANGHEVDRVFVEEGASAKTSNRPQLQAMLTYCEKNGDRIDLVVVYKVDRLARNVEDHVAIKAALARCGVMLAAAAETFDDSPMGNFFETVMAGVAQVDNDMRAKKTRHGMVAAVRDGRWVHQAPLGYVKPTSKTGPSLVPDPDSAFFVREAFQRASLWAEPRERIRRDLVERGFTTSRGKAVSAQSFTNMLKNPTYHGRMLVGGSINFDGPGDFEPLIDEALFDQVQQRPRESGKRQLDNPDFPLRRFVRCGHCDTPLTGSWSTGPSKRYPYYRCREASCRGVRVRRSVIDADFEAHLQELTANAAVLELVLEAVRDECRSRSKAARIQLTRLNSRREEVERRKQRVLEAYLYDNAIDEATHDRETERLDRDLDKLLAEERKNLPLSEAEIDRATTLAVGVLQDLPGYWNQLEPAQRPGFLHLVHPDGIAYGDQGFGTADSPLFFLPPEAEMRGEANLVPRTGFEPVLPA